MMPLPDTATGLEWSSLVNAAKAYEGRCPPANPTRSYPLLCSGRVGGEPWRLEGDAFRVQNHREQGPHPPLSLAHCAVLGKCLHVSDPVALSANQELCPQTGGAVRIVGNTVKYVGHRMSPRQMVPCIHCNNLNPV